MKIKDIISYFEEIAPLKYQESYDNSGLIIGNQNQDVNSVLLTLDITEAVVDEAISKKSNLIISHHPIIFSGLKKITGADYIQRCIIKAIKHDIAIYACHTNLDSVFGGVNSKICEKIGLQDVKIINPLKNQLKKLVTFIPSEHTEKVKNAVFQAGAGHIGNYDCCSYNISGEGTFRASENANPFVGEIGKIHTEKELRFETIFPVALQSKIIDALISSHPYEEVAYDIYPLDNEYNKVGVGMYGNLEKDFSEIDFLNFIKETFNVPVIRHTNFINRKIKKVAVCGGSGSFLVNDLKSLNIDAFISADFKYHQFFDAEGRFLIADIGHYESEQFTIELFYDILKKNIPNFTVYLSQINTNPINYYK